MSVSVCPLTPNRRRLSGLAKSVFCPDTQFNGVFDDFKKIGARA